MNGDERQILLQVARAALIEELGGAPAPLWSELEASPSYGGLFVSLYDGADLRGCIGTFAVDGALLGSLAQIARHAGRDPRFIDRPMTLADLPRLRVTVSLLGALERAASPADFVIGVHGVLIRRALASGCFLPEVAAERGWTVEELLTYCCAHKAELPPDAWRDPDTHLYRFTTEVLREAT
ncbi:MAG TPA: AmmeMemoRadiSam system protein A [Phycisphaerae bacterium]|jgi:AmmeMemoRadiSam system protein A